MCAVSSHSISRRATRAKSARCLKKSQRRSAQLLDQLGCKLAERVVARAHHDDAVARAGECQEPRRDLRSAGKMFCLSAGLADARDDGLAPDRTIDRATEIDRVGEHQHVLV